MIRPDKRNTVRGLLFQYFLLPFVYTIEASFGIMRDVNVNEDVYLKFGENIVEVVEEFMIKYVPSDKSTEVVSILESIKTRGEVEVG